MCSVFIELNHAKCVFHFFVQGRKNQQDVGGDGELKKFDGAGYDKDLVEALERDIISRNPNIHWYVYSLWCFPA